MNKKCGLGESTSTHQGDFRMSRKQKEQNDYKERYMEKMMTIGV